MKSQCALTTWPSAKWSKKGEKKSAQERFTLVALKGTMTVSNVSHSIKTSGRNNEKMFSVTHMPWTIQVRGQQPWIRTSCRSRIPGEPRRKEPLAARNGALVIALIVIRRTPSLAVAHGADICRRPLGNSHRGGCRDKHLCCGRIWGRGRGEGGRGAWDTPQGGGALAPHTPGCRCSFTNIWTNSLGLNGCGRCAETQKWFSVISKRDERKLHKLMLLSRERKQGNRRKSKVFQLRLNKKSVQKFSNTGETVRDLQKVLG